MVAFTMCRDSLGNDFTNDSCSNMSPSCTDFPIETTVLLNIRTVVSEMSKTEEEADTGVPNKQISIEVRTEVLLLLLQIL